MKRHVSWWLVWLLAVLQPGCGGGNSAGSSSTDTVAASLPTCSSYCRDEVHYFPGGVPSQTDIQLCLATVNVGVDCVIDNTPTSSDSQRKICKAQCPPTNPNLPQFPDQQCITKCGIEYPDTTPPVTTATPGSGVYHEAIDVTLQSTDGGTDITCASVGNLPLLGNPIYYTTNGIDPTVNSQIYTQPISITNDTVLKFFSIDCSKNKENVKVANYTIKDDTAPTVIDKSPSDGAIEVAINAPIVATFSEKVDPSTITASSFKLDNGVAGLVTYDQTSKIATLKPFNNLAPDTLYTATLSSDIADLSGNHLSPTSWTFETQRFYELTPINGPVATDGQSVIIGLPGANGKQGAAYIFHYDASADKWDNGIELYDELAAPGHIFGSSVAVRGDFAAVSTSGTTASAYLYYMNPASGTWEKSATLVSGLSNANTSIAIDNDTMVVGVSYYDFDPRAKIGNAYVFHYSQANSIWESDTVFSSPDNVIDDDFGHATAISGDYMIIGAFARNSFQGAAYIYHHDPNTGAWDQGTEITAADGLPNEYFGNAVAISGNYAVVGTLSNKAYIFYRDPNTGIWDKGTSITPSNGLSNGGFGYSVSVVGDNILVGAPAYDGDAGAVYQFQYNSTEGSWKQIKKDMAAPPQVKANFGLNIASYNNMAIVTAPGVPATYVSTQFIKRTQ